MSLINAEQIVAGGVNRPGELDLSAGEVAFAVLGKLIGKDQQAVERRAQLVRHVGQEFGLVLRGEGKLLGFFFQAWRACSTSLFLRSTSTFCSASSLAFSSSSALVCCKFFLLALQFAGQRLRLLEQIFGSHVRFDRVEHDADRFGELIEERLVGRAEPVEAGQFHDGLHLPSNTTGSTMMFSGLASPRPEVIWM